MKSKWLTFLGLLVLAGLVLSACATPAPDDSEVTDLQAQLEAALSDAGASDEEVAALQAQLEDAIAAAEAAAAAAAEEEDMGPEPVTITFNWGTEPPTLDPSMGSDTTSSNIAGSIFMALTDQDDATKEIIPSLATSWEPNEDSTVWTFHLRDDVPWVQHNSATGEISQVLDDDGNPRIVNAHDVEYGVRRTCDPNTASDYAWILYSIKGCQTLVATDPSAEDFQEVFDALGVRAVDDTTVEFTLEFGAGFFPGVATMSPTMAQPQWVIDEVGERWVEPGFIVSYGAYVLSDWVHGDHTVLEKNPFWPLWGTDYAPGNIERAVGYMIQEASTEFSLYQNNEIDAAGQPGWGPPQEQIESIKADPVMGSDLAIEPENCTYFYGFVTTKAPTDDVRVRQALSMAIDRPNLVENVTQGGQIPANTFTNPLNFGHAAEDPDIAPWALTEEKGGTGYAAAVEMGLALLADAGYPNGAGLDILAMHNVSEGHARIMQAIQAMWQEAYPEMTVTVETQEWGVYLDTIRASTAIEQVPNVYRLGWCGDYPHANNWMHEVFNPEEGSNRVRFSPDDPQVGDLIAEYTELTKAAQTASPEDAIAMYKRAEKLLIEEIAGIAPIYYYSGVNLSKPWLQQSYDPIKLHLFQWIIDQEAQHEAMQ